MNLTFAMVFCAVLTLAAAAVVYGFVSASRQVNARHRQASLLNEAMIAGDLMVLLLRGYKDAWLCFSDTRGGRFVQFRKQVREDGSAAIESIFPRADWSEPYYAKVLELLQELGIPSARIALREHNAPVEYIQSDLGEDVNRGATFVVRTFREVFQFEGASIHLESDRISYFLSEQHPIDPPRSWREFVSLARKDLTRLASTRRQRSER